MPNTNPPVVDRTSHSKAQAVAAKKSRCDYAFFLAADMSNVEKVSKLASQYCGLEIYLGETFGHLNLNKLRIVYAHFADWNSKQPLVVHAEGFNIAATIALAALENRHLHVCHVSRREEILLIKRAKEKQYRISCEVTPHHLFLYNNDVSNIGAGRSEVRPILASQADQQALWDNLDVFDCFATDHAPHTLAEKDGIDYPPGFPGLETTLTLFLTAVTEGRLSLDDLVERMYQSPRKIFGLPKQDETFIDIDLDAEWRVNAEEMKTRSN